MRFGIRLPTILALLALGIAVATIVGLSLNGNDASAQDTTIIDTGPETSHIDPVLWGMLYKHAAGESTPSTVKVIIGPEIPAYTSPTLFEQITGAGGSKVEGEEDTWIIPIGAVAAVVQRPDVRFISLTSEINASGGPSGQGTGTYNRMNDALTEVVRAHQNGVPESQAALKAFYAKDNTLAVSIRVSTEALETQVRNWLTSEDIHARPKQEGDINSSGYTIHAMLPVGKAIPLSTAFPTAFLSAVSYSKQGLPMNRSLWPQFTIDLENEMLEIFTSNLTTDELREQENQDASDTDGPTGQIIEPGGITCTADTISRRRGWETDLNTRLNALGVSDWRSACEWGEGARVGIIDWGFANINDDPDLPRLDIYHEDDNPEGNAYCQDLLESTWPIGIAFAFLSTDCEPLARANPIAIDHGTNIAELVNDIAPRAKLFFAQANSPRQVYDAADWLTNVKDVDVIVHAGGWAYDGKGDGTSVLSTNLYHQNQPEATDNANEHSPYRYYPSPLNTLDAFVTPTSGPVWINAAGNQEKLTFRMTASAILGGTSSYSDFFILNPNATGTGDELARNKTCQPVPTGIGSIYLYSLRWADNWNGPSSDLDFFVVETGKHPTASTTFVLAESTNDDDQFPSTYPIRRLTAINATSKTEMCLFIRANPNSNGIRIIPSWIQFQILTNSYDNHPNWNTGKDSDGHSIVNPASSSNPGLIAVGARNMRNAQDTTSPDTQEYSSRGPVFSSTDNVITATPGRVKPDITGPSGVATRTKWVRECNENAATCGEDLYFGGTSAATGQVGGLAALVVEIYRDLGAEYNASGIADFLKATGKQVDTDASLSNPNNEWGNGFVTFHCRPEIVAFPYTSTTGSGWTSSDCNSTRQSGSKADYYSFYLSATTPVVITLTKTTTTSSANPFLYLLKGAHTGGAEYLNANDNYTGLGTNSKIIRTLDSGVYTVVATTNGNATSDYSLSIANNCAEGSPNCPATATHSASIANLSTATILSNSTWNTFSLTTNVPVNVVANPTGTTPRIEIDRHPQTVDHCPAESPDMRDYLISGSIYISACSTGTGKIEIRRTSDNHLLQTYTINVTYGARPTIIYPEYDGHMQPTPSDSKYMADGTWHQHTVVSGGPVRVIVNPISVAGLHPSQTSQTPLVEITAKASAGDYCDGEMDNSMVFNNGDTFYIAGCTEGRTYVALRRDEDQSQIRAYGFTVRPSTCQPVSNANLTRNNATSVKLTWQNSIRGLPATGRRIDIRRWASNEWVFERYINEPASSTSAWHLGIDSAASYAYTINTKCGTTFSSGTPWAYATPYSSGSGTGNSPNQQGEPSPTPTPGLENFTNDSTNNPPTRQP